MFPKPPLKQPAERKPLKRRARVKRVRAKARAGRKRGKDMSALRAESWEERGALCLYCAMPVSGKYGELAHIKGKRMWGDNKENVAPAHRECHRRFHEWGPSMTKPVPTKETS